METLVCGHFNVLFEEQVLPHPHFLLARFFLFDRALSVARALTFAVFSCHLRVSLFFDGAPSCIGADCASMYCWVLVISRDLFSLCHHVVILTLLRIKCSLILVPSIPSSVAPIFMSSSTATLSFVVVDVVFELVGQHVRQQPDEPCPQLRLPLQHELPPRLEAFLASCVAAHVQCRP